MMDPPRHPKCNGNSRRKLCSYDCDLCHSRSLASTENAYLWHTDSNKGITARDVFKRSEKEFMFYCVDCNHLFSSPVKNISISGCPFCANPSRKLCSDSETCEHCYERSFASSELAHLWHPDNVKTPRQVFKSTHDKYKFICDNENCGHVYEAELNKITVHQTRCPFCCVSGRKLCPDKECKICIPTTFKNHEKSEFWDYTKNDCNPEDCTMATTTRKYWFICETCDHSFDATLAHITKDNRWCPFCATPSKKLCPDDDCEFCTSRSLASLNIDENWSDKNLPLRPRDVILGSHEKYIFDCHLCNKEFTMSLENISGGCWCTCRKNKTEAKLREFLEEEFGSDNVLCQPKFPWCQNKITKRLFPFDFFIYKIIELDGPQHFVQVSNWQAPEITQSRDLYKEFCATDNGYSIIRLLQEDVLYDNFDWKTMLLDEINLQRDIPAVITLYNGIRDDEKRTFELNYIDAPIDLKDDNEDDEDTE